MKFWSIELCGFSYPKDLFLTLTLNVAFTINLIQWQIAIYSFWYWLLTIEVIKFESYWQKKHLFLHLLSGEITEKRNMKICYVISRTVAGLWNVSQGLVPDTCTYKYPGTTTNLHVVQSFLWTENTLQYLSVKRRIFRSKDVRLCYLRIQRLPLL